MTTPIIPTPEQLREAAAYVAGVRAERAAVITWLRRTGREMDARAVERDAHHTGEAN